MNLTSIVRLFSGMILKCFAAATVLCLFTNVLAVDEKMEQKHDPNDDSNNNVNGNINNGGRKDTVNNDRNSDRNEIVNQGLNKETEVNLNVLTSDRSLNRQKTVRKSPNVINQLKSLGRAGEQRQADHNPHLEDFLSKHAKPEITLKEESDLAHFYLSIDRRYSFRPNVRLAPFRSFAEPWPLPQEYRSNPETVFRINRATFQIMILNRTSDILQDAIKRYTEIILKRSLEEPYSFVNNFHENFLKYNTDDPKKYDRALPLPRLSVYVSGSDAGFPQLNCNETCKYLTIIPIFQFNHVQICDVLASLGSEK